METEQHNTPAQASHEQIASSLAPGKSASSKAKGSYQGVPGTNRNTKSKAKTTIKKNFNRIHLDIEAINELYDYGGEQGSKKQNLQDELMDFETGILELAS